MRVVYLTDTIRMGGAERVLADLARAAVAAGHHAIVLAPQPYLVEALAADVPGADVRRFGDDAFRTAPTLAARGRSLLAQVPALVRAMRSLRPDVLHVSNGGHPGSGLCCMALPAARVAGVPRRILSVHASPRPRSESQVQVQWAIDRLVWSSAQTVVGATAIVGERLRSERGMPAGVYVRVPYGVAEPRRGDRVAVRAGHGIAADEPLVVVAAAASDEQKGHAVLVEALALAPGVRCVMAGAAPPRRALARVEELGLGGRVVVAGRVPDLGPLLAAADAVVVPSIADESLPLIVLEAMAVGVPVLASRLAGIPEAVLDGVTGRLFAPGDADALGALLRELAAGPDAMRALGAAGRERWRGCYSIAAMTEATLALYR